MFLSRWRTKNALSVMCGGSRLRISVGTLCLGGLLSVGGCEPSAVPTISWLHHSVIDAQPNSGEDCCTDVLMLGDLNGDGKLDVVIGAQNAAGASLVWYQYPTWERHPIAIGEFTTDGQLADIDGDGDLDIVVGALPRGTGEILWFENTLTNEGSAWTRHTIGKGYAHDVVVGDLDGDGRMDVVTCDKKRVVLWKQITPDLFHEHILAERQGEGIALADIDGDRDLDVVFGGAWLENPGHGNATSPWQRHVIAPTWYRDTKVAVADMNHDSKPDVVLSVSEGPGSLSWFESPPNPRSDAWIEHPIEKGILEGAHSLQVADFDGNGTLDVLTAEMHTAPRRRVLVYLNTAAKFSPVTVSLKGSHNMRIGDIDEDGDFDLVGKNYAGIGREIEMWENLTGSAGRWTHLSIDADRPSSQRSKMGLAFADVNGDGRTDVVAGAFLYRNPGGDLRGTWNRNVIADEEMDTFFAIDVDGDRYSDLIGLRGTTVYWAKATDESAKAWTAQPVAQVANGRTQGYAVASLIPQPRPQLVFTRGNNLYVLEIPDPPAKAGWPLHRISTATAEEGIGIGDIDGDGDLDIAAVGADGHSVVWLGNPGSLSNEWQVYTVGGQVDPSKSWIDRIALADINGDGRPDVVATEERQDLELRAHLYWFENPGDPKHPWVRRIISRHRSLNSMDTGDLDGNGTPDIVVAEHTDLSNREGAPDNLTVIYLNRNGGDGWTPIVVERGPHSSHLGARLADLDGDGAPEIVSIAWNQFRWVHLWKSFK